VIHLPAQDLLSVSKVDGIEVLIPFVKQIVPEVDLRKGQLVITPPPGLLDDSQAIEAGESE
jgi:16S rRNA processing protein RimM